MSIDILRRRGRPSRPFAAYVAPAVLALALCARPGRVASQRLPQPRFAAVPPALVPLARRDTLAPEASGWDVGLGAAMGGLLGTGAGALLGYFAGGGKLLCGDDTCGSQGAILGALAGEPVGMGVGAHLANRRRGNATLDVLGAAAAGYLFAFIAAESQQPAMLVVAGLVQVGATVAIERASGRDRSP